MMDQKSLRTILSSSNTQQKITEEEILFSEKIRLLLFYLQENVIYILLLLISVVVLFMVLFYLFKIKNRRKRQKAERLLNVAFYRNEIPSRPDGEFIEDILTYWKGDYRLLEINHSYIQWLFPNNNPGVNPDAYPLTMEEAKIIRETPLLKKRVKRAFEMMLDFYGMKLTNDNRFELSSNAAERLKVLNQWGNHNFLRISRILLALKELGHSNLIAPWMKFLADLIYTEDILDQAITSFENYWLDTLDTEDRIELNTYLKQKQNY